MALDEATPTALRAGGPEPRPPNQAEDAAHILSLLAVTAREALEAHNRWALTPLVGPRRDELQDAMDQLALALYGYKIQ
jgi:hypothetical protein